MSTDSEQRILLIAFGREFVEANNALTEECTRAYDALTAMPDKLLALQKVARKIPAAEDGGHFDGDMSTLLRQAEGLIKRLDRFSDDYVNAVARLSGME